MARFRLPHDNIRSSTHLDCGTAIPPKLEATAEAVISARRLWLERGGAPAFRAYEAALRVWITRSAMVSRD